MIKIKIAKNLEDKLIGLMGIKPINHGLLIPNCNRIHTYNMLDNIDILFLDLNYKIIFKFMNVTPNKIIMTNKNTHVLELPKHTSINYSLGDYLSFKDKNIV